MQKYKSAKQFKKKGCSHYDKLCVISGDTTASGVNQYASTRSPSISNDDGNEGDNDFDNEGHSHDIAIKQKRKQMLVLTLTKGKEESKFK